MSFIVKTRGAGGYIVAEYRCPMHGVFEATVMRGESGDAPDEQSCPVAGPYRESHDDDLETGDLTIGAPVPCGLPSPWTISSPKPRVLSVVPTAAVRGGDMKDRPPWMLDTRPLAEGMPYAEWSKKQDNLQQARRHQELIDKGITQKKVIIT